MVVRALLELRLAAQIDPERLVELLVGGGDDDREESIASAKVMDVLDQLRGQIVGCGGDGERNQRFI